MVDFVEHGAPGLGARLFGLGARLFGFGVRLSVRPCGFVAGSQQAPVFHLVEDLVDDLLQIVAGDDGRAV